MITCSHDFRATGQGFTSGLTYYTCSRCGLCAVGHPPGSQVDPEMALPHRRVEDRPASNAAVDHVEAAVHARAIASLDARPPLWQRVLAWILGR